MMAMLAGPLSIAALAMVGLMAGFFYAFSFTVMPGLDRADPAAAVEAMRAVNLAVRNPLFFVTFFLTVPLAALAALALWMAGYRLAALSMAAACLAYILGVLAPTAVVNVPMNEALARLPSTEIGGAAWADYSGRWTAWNHVRTAASTLALALAGLALWLAGGRPAPV